MGRIPMILIATVLAAVASSTPAAPERQFAGVWKGEYRGQTFCVLKLERAGDGWRGTISTGSVLVDAAGEVSGVEEEANGEYGLAEVRVSGEGALTFVQRDADRPIRYEMRLVDETRAELRMMDAPIRPFRLKKGG